MKTGQATAGKFVFVLSAKPQGITKTMLELNTFASTLRKFREDRFPISLVYQIPSQ